MSTAPVKPTESAEFTKPTESAEFTEAAEPAKPAKPAASTITIAPFLPADQPGMVELVLPIQQTEFGIAITLQDQPDLLDPAAFFQHGSGNVWLAKAGEMVVGSIGLLDIGQGITVLRKMFVKQGYRGRDLGVASALLDSLLAHCRHSGVQQIYLGTTAAYLAAHRFYEKNGFVEIAPHALPANFPRVSVDSKFYRFQI